MEVTDEHNQLFPILEDGEQGFNISSNATFSDSNGRLVSDLWVSIVLILMALSCIGCVCSCLLYYKFQKWKVSDDSEEAVRNHGDLERRPSKEGPPSYTLVTGLPTYEQAVVLARGSPAYSITLSSNSTPMRFGSIPRDEAQMSSIITAEISRSKGVYPNPPLTPPTVSPSRVPTGSVSRPVIEVHHIKI